MISAVNAKKKTEECDVSKELRKIENKIISSTEDGYDFCILESDFVSNLSSRKWNKIREVLIKHGYEIDPNDIIRWGNAEDEKEWVERKRYDGSVFYICGSCGGVAAVEKEDSCPNCKCRMRK